MAFLRAGSNGDSCVCLLGGQYWRRVTQVDLSASDAEGRNGCFKGSSGKELFPMDGHASTQGMAGECTIGGKLLGGSRGGSRYFIEIMSRSETILISPK